MPGARFCQACGGALEQRDLFGKLRPCCPGCGFIHFEDPKVAAGVLVTRDDSILLTLRNHEPRMGYWSFPGGYVDRGENVEQAGAREVREETGLEVEIDRLLGVFSGSNEDVIFIAYQGHVVGGSLLAGDEASDVAFFPMDRLPDLAFPHDLEVIARLRADDRAEL
ncbi:MAG: NUDIX domain-containing protein [Dehalococcoidia bacterium]|nr:NUDIX domain-containing protein [Dehalococcoidia bacterium]